MKNVEVILEKKDYALIYRGEKLKEVAVVNGLNKEDMTWSFTSGYWAYEYDGSSTGCGDKAIALACALEHFRLMTEENYITRARLEELATHFKDGLIEDDKETAMEYFDETCEMEDYEKEFFGIGEQ